MSSRRTRLELSPAARLHFQRLLSHLSARFCDVSAIDMDGEITDALGRITRFAHISCAAFIEFSAGGAPDCCRSSMPAFDAARFPWLTELLRRGLRVRIADLDELPDDAVTDRASSRTLGVASYAGVPVRAGRNIVAGLLVAGTAPQAWGRELMEQLHLLGEVLANALAASRAQREADRLRQELAHIARVSALGELTASLAHELNQPLTAILNNAEVAQRHLAADAVNLAELRAILHDIVADDKRAAAVIGRVRNVVRKGSLDHVSLDVNELVVEVGQLVRNDAVRREVVLSLALDPDLARVRGDRVQLQQVVLNLVLNGLEAIAERRGPSAALTIRTFSRTPASATVAIDDTGTGLGAADEQRMWEPLYTTKAHGLGMGLAISRTIIEAHGGHLCASNNAAGGATFEFTLPLEPIASP